jgi:sugar phosphate isomerase/epimerase
MTRVLIERRSFLAASSLAAAVCGRNSAANPKTRLPISLFCKPFHWAPVPEMAAMARDLGFDAIELTVRREGYIQPERVTGDLPAAVEIIRKAGLSVSMITTDIVDARTPHTADMLRTASKLGIHYYRWKGFQYDYAKPLAPQLKALRAPVADLAAVTKEFGLRGLYHAHSGRKYVGANFADLWYLLEDIDSKVLGVNFDTGHATAEGGRGAWRNSLGLLLPHVGGLAVKDFVWEKDSRGRWEVRWCELGKGMIQLPEILSELSNVGFQGPVSMHFEQPELGVALHGGKVLDVPREQFLAIFRRDLPTLRAAMQRAGF